MADERKAVFLSYASQDAEAAKRICDALRAAGVEVWFDQSELRGGDSWDAKIRRQIKECALFVPIISANTNSRSEGYFRLEWKLAVDRSHLLADDHPFLFPIVISDVTDAAARVPDKFRDVQWTRLRLDETPAELAKRVTRLLSGEGPDDRVQKTEDRPVGRRHRPAWLRFAWAGVGIVFALVYAVRPLFQPDRHAAPKPPAVAPSASATETQRLVAQAQQVLDQGDELNREIYFLAEDLVKRAVALDPADAAAWTLSADLSYRMVWYGVDSSQGRVTTMRQHAERAVALAPSSLEARLVRANVRVQLREDLEGTLAGLLQLEKETPENWRVQRALGQAYRYLKRPEPALRALQRARELSRDDPGACADLANVMMTQSRFAEAEAVVTEALARRATGRLMTFAVMLKTQWRGDLAAATATAAKWPDWLLREDRGAHMAWRAWLWNRQPEQALAVAQQVPRDYLHDYYFSGPRAVLTARAQELAGHAEAAQADWREVVQLTNRELASDPGDSVALMWKAWALARLGDLPQAQAIGTQLQQQNVTANGLAFVLTSIAPFYATVGMNDAAFAELRSLMKPSWRYGVARAALELEPAYETLRGDPRYAELLGIAPAPAKLAAVFPAAPLAPPDDKSVAVLAFANLSDDKANEYFSDGISEELLNVLAKIPGLKVSARTSAFYFKGKEVPIPEIARQLGVAYVVEGSVRKQGDKVRITAQLIKAADGFHVWSDTFTRDLKDIFAVQDEIAGLIAKNLELKMGMTAPRPTVDLEAYQEYLTGKALFAKATMPDLRAAVTHLERAVAIDPKFAAAWVQLASAHTRLGRWGGTPTLQSWAAARAAIDQARALEPDSPDVLLALGWILRTADWDWRGAEQAFRRALELRPKHAETLAGAAVLFFNIGKEAEAFRLGQQAAQLDPLNAGTHIDLSLMFYFNRNWTESERAARRASQLAPGGTSYHSVLAWSLMEQKRYAEAEKEIALEVEATERFTAYGLLAIARGQTTAARQCLEQLEALAQTNHDAADLQTGIAWISAGLGDKEHAFAALEYARASRDPSMSWLRNGPYLDPLHADPRWDALLHKLGLADDQLK